MLRKMAKRGRDYSMEEEIADQLGVELTGGNVSLRKRSKSDRGLLTPRTPEAVQAPGPAPAAEAGTADNAGWLGQPFPPPPPEDSTMGSTIGVGDLDDVGDEASVEDWWADRTTGR